MASIKSRTGIRKKKKCDYCSFLISSSRWMIIYAISKLTSGKKYDVELHATKESKSIEDSLWWLFQGNILLNYIPPFSYRNLLKWKWEEEKENLSLSNTCTVLHINSFLLRTTYRLCTKQILSTNYDE